MLTVGNGTGGSLFDTGNPRDGKGNVAQLAFGKLMTATARSRGNNGFY